jgi:hypothetical protein
MTQPLVVNDEFNEGEGVPSNKYNLTPPFAARVSACPSARPPSYLAWQTSHSSPFLKHSMHILQNRNLNVLKLSYLPGRAAATLLNNCFTL